MKYRIVIETKLNREKDYYIQKKFLLYFWRYVREIRDISMAAYRVRFDSLEEAEKHIQNLINYEYNRSQQKVVKREYLIR